MKILTIPLFSFLLALGLLQFGIPGEVFAQTSSSTLPTQEEALNNLILGDPFDYVPMTIPPVLIPEGSIPGPIIRAEDYEGDWRSMAQPIFNFSVLILSLISLLGIIINPKNIFKKFRNKTKKLLFFILFPITIFPGIIYLLSELGGYFCLAAFTESLLLFSGLVYLKYILVKRGFPSRTFFFVLFCECLLYSGLVSSVLRC